MNPRKRMRKGIAVELYTVSLAVIITALVCMSSALVGVTNYFYKRDREEFLINCGRDVMHLESDYLSDGDELSVTDEMSAHFRNVSSWANVNFAAYDEKGGVLACSETSPSVHREPPLTGELMKSASEEGTFSLSTLSGYFKEPMFSALFRCPGQSRMSYLLVYMDCSAYKQYTGTKLVTAFAVFVLILLVVIPVLWFAVKRLVSPIEVMTIAAKRFGEGDFSEKIMIPQDNEMGFLANSLNEMAYSLSNIESERKSFVSNVSHELKTPMTTIGGFVDGILDGTIPKEKHRHYLTIVSEEISRLSRLVRSMLNISKYESGEVKLTAEKFDLTALTVKTVLLFEHRIEAKHVEVEGLDADPHIVCADADLIQQVIYNLTENAVKFVNIGGYIRYTFREEDGSVYLAVTNSGEGLRKGEMARVFDRFYKTDESRGKDTTGVGLGLSIVRSIIKLHNGTVNVSSKEKEFTRFEFSVPKERQ